jgi:hypothetical protein
VLGIHGASRPETRWAGTSGAQGDAVREEPEADGDTGAGRYVPRSGSGCGPVNRQITMTLASPSTTEDNALPVSGAEPARMPL